jgi:hypothetical protein
MSVEQRVKAILKSAELSFELGIINATRYGPLIHANVPDYAEILLKVYLEENGQPVPSNFPAIVAAVNAHINANRPADQPIFLEISDYFTVIRAAFRNPLHHTDRVQGYVIEQREALRCLLMLDKLLGVIFPALNPIEFDELNYSCYLRYLKMEYEESLGRGNHRLYLAVAAELRSLQDEDNYRVPPEFNVSRLVAVRRLFRLGDDQFTRTVLKYRPILRLKIFDVLRISRRGMTPRQMRNALFNDPDLGGLSEQEIEACVQHIHNEYFPGQGTVIVRGIQYHLSPP